MPPSRLLSSFNTKPSAVIWPTSSLLKLITEPSGMTLPIRSPLKLSALISAATAFWLIFQNNAADNIILPNPNILMRKSVPPVLSDFIQYISGNLISDIYI